MIETDILVIGAGLAGLTLARVLAGHGEKVVVLEKSKSPGGRLSTRRSDFGSFDHGAQYLTSRTSGFTSLLNEFSQSGDLAPWDPNGKDSARSWWVGKPGMSEIGKSMARDLDIEYDTRVIGIVKQDRKFLVHTEGRSEAGPDYLASRVVPAIPAPQALELLTPLDPAFVRLKKVAMAPCWSAMLAFDARLQGVPDLIRGQEPDVLSLIARNGSKPARTGETFVLHATPQWSREHIESERNAVKSAMVSAMRVQTGLDENLPDPVHCEVHRWLYALVETPLDQPFLGNRENTLFACGDWCIGGRAEAAHQSAQALARHIMSL
ncbi:MAG: FAD-dependent oxidoreductase [Alphaproteobacteria bacterium]|nr:FAD-dependent oxidoreductase [Alphaproteobacteria bacterium]